MALILCKGQGGCGVRIRVIKTKINFIKCWEKFKAMKEIERVVNIRVLLEAAVGVTSCASWKQMIPCECS